MSDALDVLALSGNPRPGSRTAAFALRAATTVAAELGDAGLDAQARLVDLADPSIDGEAARVALAGADVAVVASPTFKGTYTGVLKAVLDGLDRQALDGVLAVPLMVHAGGAHALAADVHLRPLLLELGATCPTPSIVAGERELAGAAELLTVWRDAGGWALRALAVAARDRRREPVTR